MSKLWTTRQMSDLHESMIEERTGAKRTRGSGNQFNGQADNRHTFDVPFATAYDGKSTLGRSIGITREMWDKLKEQAAGLIPALPLRFYRNEYLTVVDLDLIVVEMEHYLELREKAQRYEEMCR